MKRMKPELYLKIIHTNTNDYNDSDIWQEQTVELIGPKAPSKNSISSRLTRRVPTDLVRRFGSQTTRKPKPVKEPTTRDGQAIWKRKCEKFRALPTTIAGVVLQPVVEECQVARVEIMFKTYSGQSFIRPRSSRRGSWACYRWQPASRGYKVGWGSVVACLVLSPLHPGKG